MNKRIYKLTGLLFLFVLTLMGCNSWLDAKPEDRVTDKQLYSTVQGFRTALNGIYVELNDKSLYGGDLLVTGIEVLAQRYDFSGNTTDISKVGNYDYTTDYAKAKFAAIWEKAYSLIANCNKLLEYAELNQDVLNGQNRELITGETYALRAFLHFDLLRLFGPIYKESPSAESIPYNTKYSISATSILPANQVIEKILNDLKTAEDLLQKSDPIIENGPQNQDSEDGLNHYTYRAQRFNYYAVKALQARVNLYAGNTEEAVKAARAVIAVQEQWFPFTKYSEIMGGTKSADRIFSSEIIFSLYHSARSDIFTDYFSPDLEPSAVYLPKKNLDKFFIQETDKDWRYSSTWLQASTRDYKCFHKYENVSTTTNLNHLIPILRITEMYYIIAEASTDATEALDAINKVLYNRGLTELPNNDNLASTVQEEYKREFWGEGQLFFYYKRVNEPSIYSFSEGKSITMDATKYVIPLPLSETDYR
ncbi:MULTISPECIES: RagB/SusD family nutrient uptake outer membrane protein [Butyricimonas]|uniref:RagB/SusD family nutrient uptake outer membrane protein n=1 Tax=Butyricimonas TaxID=574697 RepID=UPI00207F659D|nr:RagB/SusD family nutrient uptake outer membrane protein [Butyricimonas paravirosa]MBS7199381.1 RagB/SusD family nutrient uptake outer membrane protein [Bacteroidales bacterium]BDF52925.1 hypothetical protein CE91St21_03600 [Odoribacteraceae bacterium]GKH91864.1 hypothetical protein CE91St23_03600 [Odoribacteraceae bacterium]GKH96482.1 hypothetical protein CE91St22_03600 [Odoribacteraceae bacterium]GKI03361.1 hypothetical protein CE91St24_26360 [Odoribacteraceae bacterium]